MPATPAPSSCAHLLKLLADETRLAVMRQLIDGPQQVSQLNATLGLEQSLLSHHLKILREAGLVESQRQGKGVLYSLSPDFRGTSSGESINLGCCCLSFE